MAKKFLHEFNLCLGGYGATPEEAWEGYGSTHVGFKSEYRTADGAVEAYNVVGESFWGGVKTREERHAIKVQPLQVVITKDDDENG